jgi:hypothetical protein
MFCADSDSDGYAAAGRGAHGGSVGSSIGGGSGSHGHAAAGSAPAVLASATGGGSSAALVMSPSGAMLHRVGSFVDGVMDVEYEDIKVGAEHCVWKGAGSKG